MITSSATFRSLRVLYNVVQIFLPMERQLGILANRFVHSHFMLGSTLCKLFIRHMRNDLFVREIFDKFSKVPSNVSYSNVERFLELDEPVTVGDLLSREEIL